MKQHFEELKQHYPKTAKALGISANMNYEEWRDAYYLAIAQKFMRPLPVDISGLNQPVSFPGNRYAHLVPQLQTVTPDKEI